jgi:outer membrane protein TolC
MKLFALLILLVPSAFAQKPLSSETTAQLSWDTAAEILLRDNPDLQASRSLVESARQQIFSSQGDLLPQLSLTGNFTRTNPVYGLDQSYSYGAEGSQPLFSPATAAQFRKSQAEYDKARADDEFLLSGLFLNLRKAFAQLLTRRRRLPFPAK